MNVNIQGVKVYIIIVFVHYATIVTIFLSKTENNIQARRSVLYLMVVTGVEFVTEGVVNTREAMRESLVCVRLYVFLAQCL